MNRNLIMGIIIGLCLGTAPITFGYYGSYTKVGELSVGDLEEVVQKAIGKCYVRETENPIWGGKDIDCRKY